MKRFIIFFPVLLFIAFSCSNNKPIDKSTDVQLTSVDSLNKLIRKSPKNSELFAQRSNLYLAENEIGSAINDMEIALRLDSMKDENYIKLAQLYLLEGKSGKSKEILEKCIKFFPDNFDAMISLAKIHLYVKQFTEAMEYASEAQKIDNSNAEVSFIKGVIYKEAGDTASAIKQFHIASEKKDDYVEAYENLGLLYSWQENNLAIDFYEKAIKLDSLNPFPRYGLAMYFQSIEQTKLALAQYEYIVENIDSLHLNSHYNIGYIYLEAFEHYEIALESFLKCINIKNNYIEAIYNAGLCYELMQDYDNARAYYQRAMDIYPNYQKSIDALNRIDSIIYKKQ